MKYAIEYQKKDGSEGILNGIIYDSFKEARAGLGKHILSNKDFLIGGSLEQISRGKYCNEEINLEVVELIEFGSEHNKPVKLIFEQTINNPT